MFGQSTTPELNSRINSLMLELRIWAEARPAHETKINTEKILDETDEIERREQEQGTYNSLFGTTRRGRFRYVYALTYIRCSYRTDETEST
jgi:hypothetical protein